MEVVFCFKELAHVGSRLGYYLEVILWPGGWHHIVVQKPKYPKGIKVKVMVNPPSVNHLSVDVLCFKNCSIKQNIV